MRRALSWLLTVALVVLASAARAQGGPPPPVAPIVGEWAFLFSEGEFLHLSGPHVRCYGTYPENWREWVELPNCYAEGWPTEAEPSAYPCDGGFLDLDTDAYNGGGCWIFGVTESEAQCLREPAYDPETYVFTYGGECASYADPGTDPETPAEPGDLAAVAAAASAAAQAAAEAAAAAAGLRSDLVVAFWCACGALGFFGYSVGARDA